MKLYTVYKITNTINGKIYIGCHITLNPNDYYFGSGLLITKAIKKYGKHNFSKEVLFVCPSRESMYKKEIELIKKYKPYYNIAEGGVGDFKVLKSEYSFKRGSYDRSKMDYSKYKMGRLKKPEANNHGTVNQYMNKKCRCQECKTAWNNYMKLHKTRKKVYTESKHIV